MENFDAIGTYRTMDEGCPIDASGVLVDGTAGQRTWRACARCCIGIRPQFVRVVTEKMLTYALGRGSSIPICRSSARSCATRPASNYRFSSIVLGIVKSAPFQMNTKRTVEATQQAAR